ncbi:MAG: class B sortase [Firmicutes bacterium]|nr:class B sortase [Bacillota bacterium]
MRLERTKNRKKNKIRFVVIVLCMGVFLYSAWHVGSNYYRAYKSQLLAEEQARKVQEQLEEARRKAEEEQRQREEQQNQQGEENTDPGTEETYEEYVLDFSDLVALNPDIMGWLVVDGTNIDYPVLYSYTDREFYLYHNYLGEYDVQGSIYIENYNDRGMSDFNTILYGHSMLNGNMFGTLHNFSNWDFFYNYGGITLYTADKTYYYQVFETATISDSHIFTYLHNDNAESIQNYIGTLASYDNGFKKDGYNITPEDHIITLSTCTTDSAQRLVVFAVLVGVS